MIAENEMDGGTTFANNKRMRIVLDVNGVYLRTEELDAKTVQKPTAMDAATDRAVTQIPAAATAPAPAAAPAGDQGQGQAPAFKLPT